jgi:PEP-CTERM motif
MGAALMGAMIFLPIGAFAASFDPVVAFDPTTLPAVDLLIDESVPFLEANDSSAPGATDVQLDGSTDVCILIGASTTCQSSVNVGQSGPVSFLVTLTVAAINTPLITGPFTLLLSDLNPVPGYSRSDVTVDLNPDAIPGLDTSAVSPGFIWDPNNGVNGFDPFLVVQDDAFAAMGDVRYYIGWTVGLGDTVTFKYDLADSASVLSFTPGLIAHAVPVIVPEPGTALLLGLGLAGLCISQRRAA